MSSAVAISVAVTDQRIGTKVKGNDWWDAQVLRMPRTAARLTCMQGSGGQQTKFQYPRYRRSLRRRERIQEASAASPRIVEHSVEHWSSSAGEGRERAGAWCP